MCKLFYENDPDSGDVTLDDHTTSCRNSDIIYNYKGDDQYLEIYDRPGMTGYLLSPHQGGRRFTERNEAFRT